MSTWTKKLDDLLLAIIERNHSYDRYTKSNSYDDLNEYNKLVKKVNDLYDELFQFLEQFDN